MWYMFSFRAQEVILPVMMKYLEDRGNDAYRYGACQLLHAILDRVRSFICPCIRALLPRAMTLMVDPVLEISREAAQCFAILVRLAPFVPKSEHRRPAEDSGGGDSTTHVIDHLIHGKPLPPVDLPEVLKKEAELSGIELRHYQLEGISWLEFLRSVSLNGALCDDMGLGKTVQSLIAIASCHLQSPESDDGSIPVSLIVCPSSLINHWVAEIRKFFPSGTVLSGRAYTSKDKGQLIDVDGKSNIIVTSYSVLRRDISKFAKKTWKYCVLDEGHLLKNPKTGEYSRM
jgi:TATA-binding protein-associated factor